MLKERIGRTAGDLWRALGEKKGVLCQAIPECLKDQRNSNASAYMALGWLAKEGKIEFVQDGKEVLVRLTDAEMLIFRERSKLVETGS